MLPCKTKEVKIERIVEEEKNLLFLFVSYQRIGRKRQIFICFRWKSDFLLRIIQFIPSRFMIDNNLYTEIKIFILMIKIFIKNENKHYEKIVHGKNSQLQVKRTIVIRSSQRLHQLPAEIFYSGAVTKKGVPVFQRPYFRITITLPLSFSARCLLPFDHKINVRIITIHRLI